MPDCLPFFQVRRKNKNFQKSSATIGTLRGKSSVTGRKQTIKKHQ
jgi:hypothetical protein